MTGTSAARAAEVAARLADIRMQADDHHLVPASDVYPLLALVEAALKRHDRSAFPATRGESRGKHYCPTCSYDIDDQVVYVLWPCPDYQDISRGLLGEEAKR